MTDFKGILIILLLVDIDSTEQSSDSDGYHYHYSKAGTTNQHEKVGPDWSQLAQDDLMDTLQISPNFGIARNVIIFLGDGMGLATVTSARFLKAEIDQTAIHETKLTWEYMPYSGQSKVYCANQQVPDSAATATAYLCGEKVQDGVVGVNQNVAYEDCAAAEGNDLKSILHHSMEAGKRTGIISTARITHATPAATYAHSASREWESNADIPLPDRPRCRDIAYQLIHGTNNTNINVILGGGRSNFFPDTVPDPEYGTAGQRTDGINLVEDWLAGKSNLDSNQYQYVWNATYFNLADESTVDYLLGLFQPGHMESESNRNATQEPSLTEMTEKAIGILSRGVNGYFLLVESGRIDHAHHTNNAHRALVDTLEFSNAIQRAVELTSDQDTLIVVTADHSHAFSMAGYQSLLNPILGLADLSLGDDGKPYTTLGYGNGASFLVHRGTAQNEQPRRDLTGLDTTGVNYLQDAPVPLVGETHGGEDVSIHASGPMSHLFTGTHEQHYIAHAMMYASCVGDNKAHCN